MPDDISAFISRLSPSEVLRICRQHRVSEVDELGLLRRVIKEWGEAVERKVGCKLGHFIKNVEYVASRS